MDLLSNSSLFELISSSTVPYKADFGIKAASLSKKQLLKSHIRDLSKSIIKNTKMTTTFFKMQYYDHIEQWMLFTSI